MGKEYRQLLLIEGKDDFHVICSLCKDFDVKQTFGVEELHGVENLITGLPVRLKGDGEIETIGIVVDADESINGRWESIRNILEESGLYSDIPQSIPAEGLVISSIVEGGMKFGAWIMPNNQLNGMLEDFAFHLIPKDDLLIGVVDDTLNTIEKHGWNKYKLAHRAKAKIHTWLAWQEEPGTPMGQAITKKYLNTTPVVCNDLINWLNRLFNK